MARVLKARIESEMKTALLGGDRFRGETLRGLKAAILNEEIASKSRDTGLEDGVIEAVLAREVKKRKESAELYEQNGRAESAADERREADIIAEFLPQQLTEAEIRQLVDAKVSEIGNDSKAMGQIIGAIKKEAGSSVDGALLAKIVREAIK